MKKKIALSSIPLGVVSLFFGVAQLITWLGCRGFEDNCGLHWLWLLLGPIFIVLFPIAIIWQIAILFFTLRQKK